jgi:hypothetical protein
LQKLREAHVLVMPGAAASLKDLPQKNQAREDKDPEDNCLDCRIHQNPHLSPEALPPVKRPSLPH